MAAGHFLLASMLEQGCDFPFAHRIKSATMKRALMLVVLLIILAGCNQQTGYFHSTRMFTEADRNAVIRVQGSALGKPDILKSSLRERYNDVCEP